MFIHVPPQNCIYFIIVCLLSIIQNLVPASLCATHRSGYPLLLVDTYTWYPNSHKEGPVWLMEKYYSAIQYTIHQDEMEPPKSAVCWFLLIALILLWDWATTVTISPLLEGQLLDPYSSYNFPVYGWASPTLRNTLLDLGEDLSLQLLQHLGDAWLVGTVTVYLQPGCSF